MNETSGGNPKDNGFRKPGKGEVVESGFDIWLKNWFESYGVRIERGARLFCAYWKLLIPAVAIAVLVSACSFGLLFGPAVVSLYGLVLHLIDQKEPVPQVRDLLHLPWHNLRNSFMFGIIAVGVTALFCLPVLSIVPLFGLLLVYLFLILLHGILFFAPVFIADKDLSAKKAVLKSFEMVGQNLLPELLFSLVVLVFGVFGIVVFYIGIVVTAPLYFCAVAVSYREVTVPRPGDLLMKMMQRED